jgi:hypothetical protein
MLKKSAGKIQKNPNLDFPAPEKCRKNPKNPIFGFFSLENAGKVPEKSTFGFFVIFPALIFIIVFDDIFLLYIYLYIFHILYFFS